MIWSEGSLMAPNSKNDDRYQVARAKSTWKPNFAQIRGFLDSKWQPYQTKRWISIRNIIIYLEAKFRPNRRIFVFWQPFWIQNGRHMVQHVLLPVNIHFHWNLLIFLFLTIYLNFFNFYIGGHFENFKNKEHNFEWWSIFVSSFKRFRCTEWI